MNSLLLLPLVLGPVAIVEQDEEKSSGYVFLGGLPVTRPEIVRAKFALPLMAAVAGVIGNIALIRSWAGAPELRVAGVSAVMVAGAVCLGLAGLAYVGIFGLGYTRFFVVAMVGILSAGLVPQILFYSRVLDTRAAARGLALFLQNLNQPFFALAAVAVYAVMMLGASAIMGFEPKKKYFGWM